jgi:hypothetical protein
VRAACASEIAKVTGIGRASVYHCGRRRPVSYFNERFGQILILRPDRLFRPLTEPLSTRDLYMNRANTCLGAAEVVFDPAERAALTKVAACYVMLADYVAARQERGTAHREDRAGLQPDS